MATKKKYDTPRLDRLHQESDGLTGFDKALLDDLLTEYDALASMTEALRLVIQEKGVMEEKEVGTVNNRHIERVERAEFKAYQKAIGRLGDLAKKVSSFAKNATAPEEEDEFDAFNA